MTFRLRLTRCSFRMTLKSSERSGRGQLGGQNEAHRTTFRPLFMSGKIALSQLVRPSGRAANDLRQVSLEPHAAKYAEGSCLAKFGDTHVLCTASIDEKVPPFLRNSGKGWVTAEYGMLPRSTHSRTDREAAKGKQSGRTQEIQRLIGRSLRAVTDLAKLGERQIRIDCDVLQADGGTRTAAVTGSYVALHQAFGRLVSAGQLAALPLADSVAAVSCG